jgi:hypothetical protein
MPFIFRDDQHHDSGSNRSLKNRRIMALQGAIKVLTTEGHLYIRTGDIAADAQNLVDICVQKKIKNFTSMKGG